MKQVELEPGVHRSYIMILMFHLTYVFKLQSETRLRLNSKIVTIETLSA